MEDLIIKQNKGRTDFDVHQGDKYCERVTYDEMLGLISQLTMPKERHCLNWMKTKEQWDAWRSNYLNKD